jgi:hypothetical protein
MAVCARAVQQADGTLLLALDPAAQDLSACPYVVDDGASNAWRELGNMSIENAQVLGVAVGVVWAIAFTFRLLIKAVSIFESPET